MLGRISPCHAVRRAESSRKKASLIAREAEHYIVVVGTRLMHVQHVACRPNGSILPEQMQKDLVSKAATVPGQDRSIKLILRRGSNNSVPRVG